MEKIFGETASIGGKSRRMLTAGLCEVKSFCKEALL